jgi:hypothetical protein
MKTFSVATYRIVDAFRGVEINLNARVEVLLAVLLSLLGCSAVTGRAVPVVSKDLLKVKTLRCFETTGTTRPTTQRHIPEDLNLYLSALLTSVFAEVGIQLYSPIS